MEYVLSHQSRGWIPIEKWVSVRSRTLRRKDRRSLVCCPCRNTVVLCDMLPPCLLASALTSPFSLTVPVETFSCTPVLCSTLAFPFGWAGCCCCSSVVVCAPTDKAIPSPIEVARQNSFIPISPPFFFNLSLGARSADLFLLVKDRSQSSSVRSQRSVFSK